MSCTAKVIADSLAPCGRRLTSFELYYGRPFHAELMTHAEFARNSSSSRAIPWSVMQEAVKNDPWMPICWGSKQKGMQMGQPLDPAERNIAVARWLMARDDAVDHADYLVGALGLHKSNPNRLIEPFAHIRVVISGTQWGNFFNLRLHKAALPDFQQLAKKMAQAYQASRPLPLQEGQWHLPYVSVFEHRLGMDVCKRASVARCARTSYRLHCGGDPTVDKDLELYDQLMSSAPVHASPAGHQAMATGDPNVRSGNFLGWVQHRQTIPNHYTPDFDVASRLVEYDGVDFML